MRLGGAPRRLSAARRSAPGAALARWSGSAPAGTAAGEGALAEALARGAGGAAAGDATASARWLLRCAADPVWLEPSPAPLLALRAAQDERCTPEDFAATAALHDLGADAAIELADTEYGTAAATAAESWLAARF